HYYDHHSDLPSFPTRRSSDLNNNLLHDGRGSRIYPSNEQRSACQSYLIDAERNIQSAFNYSSGYSLLSKFSKKIHEALSSEHKEDRKSTRLNSSHVSSSYAVF